MRSGVIRSASVATALLAVALLPATAVAQRLVDGTIDERGYERVRGNPADRLAHLSIDDYRYDRATGCRRRPQPGTLALQSWLASQFAGSSWGIMRCSRLGSGSFSLHAEGRALDWHLSVHQRSERREAQRLIALLLAPDRVGNAHALARRMGIQEIIWNCRAWWSGSQAMTRYSACYDRRGRRRRIDDTTAHRDHVHLGLTRLGARAQTTFWRARR
jgi:hypothetical protein